MLLTLFCAPQIAAKKDDHQLCSLTNEVSLDIWFLNFPIVWIWERKWFINVAPVVFMLLSFCLCCLVVAKEYILSSSPPTLSSSRWGCGCQSGPWFRSTLSVSWVLWFCSFPILLSKMFVSLNFLRKSLMATFIKPGRRGSRCDNPQWKRGWSDLGNSWKILHLKVFIFYLISSFLSLRTAHQSFFKWTLTWRLCCDNQQWSDNRQRHCRSTSWFASHRLSRSSPVGDSWYIIIMKLLPFFQFLLS